MRTLKVTSVAQVQLASRFETLRQILLGQQYASHWEKPLVYWAVPTDRRLPLALLGRSLGELIQTPYAELAATPGIGQKKMQSFVRLLARAVHTDPADLPRDLPDAFEPDRPRSPAPDYPNGFDPAAVSELVWSQWRATVLRHGLAKEPLGRLAPSLRALSRVIWHTPLDTYARKTLAEIRAMKTHGEKRVRAILAVFHAAHRIVAQLPPHEQLAVRLVARQIDAVERWIAQALSRPDLPTEEEIRLHLVQPLLKQIRCDGSRQVLHVAEHRLGVRGPATSVRQAARALGLTRARVYQLLTEIADIMQVRWPMGRYYLGALCDRFRTELPEREESPNLEPLTMAMELFYPSPAKGSAGAKRGADTVPGSPELQTACPSKCSASLPAAPSQGVEERCRA